MQEIAFPVQERQHSRSTSPLRSITKDSLSKFHIYAALKVPEVWRYDGKTFQFYQLAGASYHKTAESSALPGLKPQMLAAALDESKVVGQTDALAAFRKSLA